MAEGKWIAGLEPEMRAAEAARVVLAGRLAAVKEWLATARGSSGDAQRDPEHVHQLRVSTRRADAAVRIFRGCLTGSMYRRMRTALRGLRQAAGAARDWDVFLLEMQARRSAASAEEAAGLDLLVGYGLGRRQAVQANLDVAMERGGEDIEDLDRRTGRERRERGTRADESERLATLARKSVAELVEKLNRAVERDLADYDNLHQVRIAGKRLRYALEVLACCFGPELRERWYPQVEEMQELLGAANDSQVAQQRLVLLETTIRTWPLTWERARPAFEMLLRFHADRIEEARQRFSEAWERWQREVAPGMGGERRG